MPISGEESVSDQELFNEAVSDTPSVEAPAEEPVAETKEGRERDEKGRFAAKKEDDGGDESPPSAEAAVEAPKVETPDEDKPEHRIPSWRLKEEADAKREAMHRAEAAERAAQQFQSQLAQLQQQLQALQQPQEPIDIFAQPEAYQQRVEQMMEQRLKAMEGNFSLRLAHGKHGDLFTEAWKEMASRTQAGDDSMRQQVIASSDPGETLVQLYQREKVMKEVGPDPTAYINQKMEDALNDEAFLAKAYEKFKAKAGGQSAQTKNKIELPPSLNKVASAGSVDGDTDMSGGSLYNYATR
jgi:hypothetical protein